MKIALLTLGTRGDVQPYAALGRAFNARGHQAILSSGKNFEALSNDYGVQFIPVNADFQALVNSPEGREMMKNPFRARKHFKKIVQPMMIEAMREFFDLARSVDAVLYHVKSLGDFFADQLPGKMIRANVIPAIEHTSAFPNPVFSALGFPGFLNRFTYTLADLGLAMMNDAIREFRLAHSLPAKFTRKPECPSIYGISPLFLPMPKDYPSNSYFSGFWQSHSNAPIPGRILELISGKKKTVLLTFGSMPFETNFDLPGSLKMISDTLGINIIIVKGWGFLSNTSIESDSIVIIDSAPYDKLIPLVDAVIFHGGIGTMAECLRAGTPFMTCPVIYPMGDQFFWGKRAYELGCSPKPVPLKKLTDKILKENMENLLSSPTYRENCKSMASSLAREDGLANAVDFVESYLR